MGADNWQACPKCQSNREEYINRLKQELEDSYGLISKEDWMSKRDFLDDEERTALRETLREDWEIGIYGAEFDVSYRASCRTWAHITLVQNRQGI